MERDGLEPSAGKRLKVKHSLQHCLPVTLMLMVMFVLGSEEHFCDMPPLEWSTDEEGPVHLMPPDMPPLEWSTDEEATEHYSGESDPGEFFSNCPFEYGGYTSDVTSTAQSYSHQFKCYPTHDPFPNYDSES